MQQRRRQKPRCVAGSWLFVVAHFMAVACIYRKNLSRVTASHNRLDLSILKCIKHKLIAIINGKRMLRTYEALGRISVDHSHAHRAPMPITSPHHAMPCHARRGERAHACISLFFLSSTLLQVYREQPTI
jgi:hypothetical protein